MPELLPFRGIRYAEARPAQLGRLISPPYDVVTPAERDALAARSPFNAIHLTLDEVRPGDGPEENRYVRAARSLRRWLEEGVLREERSPALYGLLAASPVISSIQSAALGRMVRIDHCDTRAHRCLVKVACS